jgi:hypothetical protein
LQEWSSSLLRAHRYKYEYSPSAAQDPISWFILIIAAGQTGAITGRNAVVTIGGTAAVMIGGDAPVMMGGIAAATLSQNAVAISSQNAVAICDAMKDSVIVIVRRNVTRFAERPLAEGEELGMKVLSREETAV